MRTKELLKAIDEQNQALQHTAENPSHHDRLDGMVQSLFSLVNKLTAKHMPEKHSPLGYDPTCDCCANR